MIKAKYKRLGSVFLWISIFALGIGLILYTLKSNIIYFVTPSELIKESPSSTKIWRLGGLATAIKFYQPNDKTYIYEFIVSDNKHNVKVIFKGIPPQLFREKQGVVAEGTWQAIKLFQAEKILIKHDETYRPPQTSDNLTQIQKSIVK